MTLDEKKKFDELKPILDEFGDCLDGTNAE